MAIKPKDMVKVVDYTILDPTVTVSEVKKICEEAKEYNLVAVCVNPCFVPLAAQLLKDSSVKVSTVIGFPLGASTAKTKAYETKDALDNGAQEIEVVIRTGDIKKKNWNAIRETVKPVIEATKLSGVSKDIITKAIVEISYLEEEEIIAVSKLLREIRVDFIKTSTGFGPQEVADLEDVALIRKIVGRSIGVETYGGVKGFDDAIEKLDAGANRIGTKNAIEVVRSRED
ncbi:deoxyribose-phosphate aldolase [Halobacteroides halobius DSM 5150]|uniref:Deoxyribose-phosphate aldolase n=1 Tax=Halobacteroides halobius (strain ATCC 35273 / DSM 5150 / MD-1) TaxID=748449 RepID=L0K9X1_HALHC|nr:deoxyribose-phosphate aldolase [Halobacteroides halobius]AGB41791.1 deoxyribose-phosphate aldolase [Halobacteroides halobius DSM 5150]